VILATPSSFVDVEIYSIEKTPPRAPKLLDRPSREPEPEPEIKLKVFIIVYESCVSSPCLKKVTHM
jgi:hypothetical protein